MGDCSAQPDATFWRNDKGIAEKSVIGGAHFSEHRRWADWLQFALENRVFGWAVPRHRRQRV